MSDLNATPRYRLRLTLPEGFESERLGPNWSDLFVGLPRESEWEFDAPSDEDLGWLIADFLALHEGVICEAAGVAALDQLENPEDFVRIEPL
jgi:hypothetical protein